MNKTHEQRIIEAIADRLRAISVASGYQTDAGAQVYRGLVQWDERDPLPLVCVHPGEISAENGITNTAIVNLPIQISGVAAATPDNPGDAAQVLCGDLQQALFAPGDFRLGGLLTDNLIFTGRRISPRAPGAAVVEVELNLSVRYVLRLAEPYFFD